MSAITEAETETAALVELVDLAAEAQRVGIAAGEVYLVRDSEGGLQVVDTDAYDATPRHIAAARKVSDAASFVNYVNRHQIPGTEVFAHTPSMSVVGVIDSHEGSDAPGGWQRHRVTLELEFTPAWKAWTSHDLSVDESAWFDQHGFAEFIESRALDVTAPDTARIIDIATTFEAKQRADFSSAVREHDGTVKFEYSETVAAKAGQKGDLKIPREFELALRPYVGGPTYKVIAQFRYRINSGGLRLGYALVRPDLVLEAAFADIVDEIRDGRHDKGEWPDHEGIGDVPIFSGKPS